MKAKINTLKISHWVGLALLPLLLGASSPGDHGTTSRPSHFKKVMIVILENTDYSDAIQQPFIADLATRGALFHNFDAERHPSQPNYIALISGATQGVTDDKKYDLSTTHIGDLLEAKGRTWKTYAEGYPEKCYLQMTSGRYVRKHTPFLSFTNVQKDPARCRKIVEASTLEKDVKDGTLPDFSLYIPDLDNDGHDTGVPFAAKWLAKRFGPLLKNPQFMENMLFIVTFDENAAQANRNQIVTIAVGDRVRPGIVSDVHYNHYSLLRTVEDEFELGVLSGKRGDSSATPILDIWKTGSENPNH